MKCKTKGCKGTTKSNEPGLCLACLKSISNVVKPWPDNHHHYEVIVGNVGTVYSGVDKLRAEAQYDTYVKDSQDGYGRAAYENVALMRDGELLEEHQGNQGKGND